MLLLKLLRLLKQLVAVAFVRNDARVHAVQLLHEHGVVALELVAHNDSVVFRERPFDLLIHPFEECAAEVDSWLIFLLCAEAKRGLDACAEVYGALVSLQIATRQLFLELEAVVLGSCAQGYWDAQFTACHGKGFISMGAYLAKGSAMFSF